MKRIISSRMAIIAVVVALAALAAGCTTVNEFDRYDIRGSRMGVFLSTPPEPEIDVSYDLTVNPENPVATIISIGTNVAKATIAVKADATMRSALESVDVPGEVTEASFARVAEALGAVRVYDYAYAREQVDYLFDVEIKSWGINADSPSGDVNFELSLVAAIVDLASDDLVWRRSIRVSEPAHPGLFGLPSEVGSAISAAALANLTESQMRHGFEALAEEAAVNVARRLERDLREARYR